MNIKLTACALIALAVSPMATAQEQFQFQFNYGLEELESATGRDALIARLDKEIVRACLSEVRGATVYRPFVSNRCAADAKADALSLLGL